ncbi:MAG: DUF1732 domain-containing protein [Bacteroidota bacterium]|nr:DUF1732 domain-containing protein [Bacteroidota bacterium]
MIKSMTGYGQVVCETEKGRYVIDLRTLNSKQLDINIKLSQKLKDKESLIRAEISKQIQRGKIDLYISEDNGKENDYSIFDNDVFKKHYSNLKILTDELNVTDKTDLVSIIVKYMMSNPVKEEMDESVWYNIKESLGLAFLKLDEYRVSEGIVLMNDISYRIGIILELLVKIDPFEKERIQRIKERINKNLLLIIESDKVDENRFEQEIIYYLEKIDITEEKVRLKTNCEYFLETISQSASEGKKLGFIAQEIGREINTIGSKANDIEIQKIVVQMKDELEKIKEQLNNVL